MQDINHLISNPDGKVWAKEFADVADRLYGVDLDKDWLEVWFSNAIMAGYDFAERKQRESDRPKSTRLQKGEIGEWLTKVAAEPDDEEGDS